MNHSVAGGALSSGLAGLILLALGGCGREARAPDEQTPRTSPLDAADPRIAYYDKNTYQISQGGRYALWYGCQSCHGSGAAQDMNLADDQWRHGSSFAEIYAFIAEGHPAATRQYGAQIPVQQLWQITAYVRNLRSVGPQMVRRQSLDQSAEPQGAQWTGPLR